jgi:hypothetical protein
MPKGGKANNLAVAYTDVNSNNKYDGKDLLIAAVVDTNKDKVVSVGDMVQFGTYPLHPDGTPGRGTFTDAAEALTDVLLATSAAVVVRTEAGFVQWGDSKGGAEYYIAQGGSSSQSLQLSDGITDPYTDNYVYVPTSIVVNPGAPDTQVSLEAVTQLGDQAFLDVFIA